MKGSVSIILAILFVLFLFFTSCDPETEKFGDCEFDARFSCSGFSFSFVNADTYENLMGPNKLIHPDSIVITNLRGDTMYHETYSFSDGWYIVQRFSVFQELHCFNQCLLDSAFTRTYYLYIGHGDTDTLEVYFPVRSERPELKYNGDAAWIREDRPDSIGEVPHWSVYWFLKDM